MPATLFTLAEGIRACTACPLHKSRTLAVPGDGPANAKLFFVGEAPGNEEDRQGKPFVGRSGKFLDQLLQKAGIKRSDVFITGAVKCHPAKNRTPSASELNTCRHLWLENQIFLIQPALVVILGTAALRSLLQKEKLQPLHGKIIEKNGQKYFITYHPAAGMRFPKIRKMMEDDFGKLKKTLEKL
ncbi:uracil-DNA glycosylase [Candidatus Woesearchaeota archaeon]|nr:uracil-DNA glycosylase [Candidatus Woesearchaeota archaeon]